MAPSPLHQAVTELFWFLSSTLQSAQWFLTEYEADRVMTDSNLIMIRTATNRPTGKKPMAFSESVDATILFGLSDKDKEPSIVFKVGLSKSHKDLLINSHQRLRNTRDCF